VRGEGPIRQTISPISTNSGIRKNNLITNPEPRIPAAPHTQPVPIG
jgi:hypothetical protein